MPWVRVRVPCPPYKYCFVDGCLPFIVDAPLAHLEQRRGRQSARSDTADLLISQLPPQRTSCISLLHRALLIAWDCEGYWGKAGDQRLGVESECARDGAGVLVRE